MQNRNAANGSATVMKAIRLKCIANKAGLESPVVEPSWVEESRDAFIRRVTRFDLKEFSFENLVTRSHLVIILRQHFLEILI